MLWDGLLWPAAALFDSNTASSEALAGRLHQHCPQLIIIVASNDPAGFELIVNATPLGMKDDDPLPFDMDRVSPDTARSRWPRSTRACRHWAANWTWKSKASRPITKARCASASTRPMPTGWMRC